MSTTIKTFAWPAIVRKGQTYYMVTFPDVPGAITSGETRQDAIANAPDALQAILGDMVEQGQDIPIPSPAKARHVLIPLPPLAAAKLALHLAMIDQGLTNQIVGNRLGVTEAVVRRLRNPDHNSKMEKVTDALAAVGSQLIVATSPIGKAA